MRITEWGGVLSGKDLNAANRVCDSGPGGGSSTLKTRDSEFPGCQGFQVPMLVPLNRVVPNTHQALP